MQEQPEILLRNNATLSNAQPWHKPQAWKITDPEENTAAKMWSNNEGMKWFVGTWTPVGPS